MSTFKQAAFTDNELRQIAVRIAEELRNHPEIDGGVSVRATLSFIEVLNAMDLLEGGFSLQSVYDAAESTFGGRIRSKGYRKTEDILQEILNKIFANNATQKELDANLQDGLLKDQAKFIEEREKEDFKNHYEKNIEKYISRKELSNLLNELQISLDLIESGNLPFYFKSLRNFYKDQYPTISKILSSQNQIMAIQTIQDQLETNFDIQDIFKALLEALMQEMYLNDNKNDLNLSPKAYELIFEDILPEIDRALTKGEHYSINGIGDEGEIFDIRRYHQGDHFKNIAIGATVKEMAKHRRRQPKVSDLRVNKLLPRRSLDIVLNIDSSRSMATHSKLFYAKKAAAGLALAAGRKSDRVGVLAFSDFATKLLDLTENVNQHFLKVIAELKPLNSTNVEDALKKSAQTLNCQEIGGQKHIIIVTDGVPTSCLEFFKQDQSYSQYKGTHFSMKAAYTQAKRCISQGITISAICIDRDEHVNRKFCTDLSKIGRGKAYFLRDERELLKITLKEYQRVKN